MATLRTPPELNDLATIRRNPLSQRSVLAVAATIVVLYFAREILIPLAFAITLDFLLYPLVTFVQKTRLARTPAVIIVILGFLAGAGAMGWVVAKQLVAVAADLPDYRSNIRAKIALVHSPAEGPVSKAINNVTDVAGDLTTPQPNNEPAQVRQRARREDRSRKTKEPEAPQRVQIVPAPVGDLQYLRDVLTPVFRPLGTTIVVLVLTTFMLIEREDLRNRILLLVGVGRIHLMTQALEDAATRISAYLGTQFLVNTGYGVIVATGLFFLGLPNATLWGVMAGLLRMIPYIGPLTAAAFPIFLSIAVFQSWLPTVAILVLFGSLELVVGNFVEPWLYGNRTGISSLALLVSALFWALLWGWAGLILSTPLTVCAIVLGRYVPQMSFLEILLGHEAELSPPATFYQRLLAGDEKDARAIGERFLEDRQLCEFYDEVLIPSLLLAEDDRHRGTLSEERANSLFSTVAELIAEFSIYGADGAQTEGAQALGLSSVATQKGPMAICLAAHDRADELTATMLAQLLQRAEHKTMILSAGDLSDELLIRFAEEPHAIVCLSALPPFAFARAMNMCRRLSERLPRNRIFAGIWGSSEETDRLKARFSQIDPANVCITLAGMMEQIEYFWKPAASLQTQAVPAALSGSPTLETNQGPIPSGSVV